MSWYVDLHPDFELEYRGLRISVQKELFVKIKLLEEFGPQLARPHVDTLEGSKHHNMKELRFNAANGVWRVAFAFDPSRKAVLLIAGDKSGVNKKRFYKTLISKADRRFDMYLQNGE